MKGILVIGESCRDIFVYCAATRLAPDVPVPVLNVVDQTENPGMAKNVWRNIYSINKDCHLATNQDWYHVTKTRYMHQSSNHMFFRVDSDHHIPRIDLSAIDLQDYHMVVIADYNKGFLTEDDIAEICRQHKRVFLDTKKLLGAWANSAFCIKINDYEYQHSKPNLSKKLINKIVHTMGGDGCEYQGVRYPVDKVEVKDTSGAGDSFMAGLAARYFATEDMVDSIRFANECASKVVKQRGVTVI
jgi:bifunctional ADP-heptose synthase (sugar kinase/adenylyltransferase)